MLKLEGENNHSIANELGIAWETVDKYWDEVLEEAGTTTDPAKLIRERMLVTEKLVSKSVRDFYAARSGIREVAVAMELADRYNGLNRHLASVEPEKLPAMLSIEVKSVPFEKPPEKQIEQVLDTVE